MHAGDTGGDGNRLRTVDGQVRNSMCVEPQEILAMHEGGASHETSLISHNIKTGIVIVIIRVLRSIYFP